MKCAEVQELLPAYVDDKDATLAVRRHLSRCAECRRELEEYGALLGELAAMKQAVVAPPAGLRASLVAIPDGEKPVEKVVTHLSRNRRAYAGGLAVAVVGAAGAALWRSRRMRPVAA
jgi:anti-sigma factor RsiW